VETRATPAVDRALPLRIQTPTAVVGVRGTEFRVSYSDVTRSEVTQGLVLAQLDAVRKADVTGGFGVKLDPAQAAPPSVVALLEAPSLANWPLKQEKLTAEFPALPNLQADKKVTAYRVQLAEDVGMAKISYNKVFPSGSVIRIPDLADGTWHASVRGIDEQGLEGKNTTAVLVLKARPQPPLIKTPKPNEKIVQGQDVPLSWAKLSSANGYLIELQDEKKQSTASSVQDSKLDLKNLAVGTYSWRIATQIKTAQGSIDTGPWADRQSFTVVALPEPMQGKVGTGDKALNLRWSDQQAKEYEVQLAGEPSFDAAKSSIVAKTTTRPEVSIPNIESGQYFIRYRATESDGFVGGWSSPMEVTVPTNWAPLWILLSWIAIAL
jgi:FecR protein